MKHLLLSALLLLAGCAGQAPQPAPPPAESGGYRSEGRASWYGSRHHGRRTASGERFDQHALTAAHRSLPFGSRVRVTNLHNRRSVVVRINDRGPYAGGRIVDLSRAAAERLGMLQRGVAEVRLELLAD
ncbi:septal ring lytic transglycosylase RlpA family protein [Pseudomonas stutzeri]|nr:septal ring lytic transglycosylase RlpA family protein [Stutzerimonas stutzeri]